MQELNPEAASAIEQDLSSLYPYRWLERRRGVTGAGLSSKHPFVRSAAAVQGSWASPPLVAELELEGRCISVVRFHAAAGPEHLALRTAQAGWLARYARERETPLLLLGDLNATDRNDVHA